MPKTAYWITFCGLLSMASHGTAAMDSAAMQRGAHVAVEVCNGCHSMKYLKYKDLLAIGLPRNAVDALRGSKGLGDPLIAQMQPNDALAVFNVVPPDLSLMAKAREGGPEYIEKLLTGFTADANGDISNRVFPGIKMPDILGVAHADPAAKQEIDHKAKDVAAFLEWAADPQAEERQHMGVDVLVYVVVLTTLLYFLKNKIWRRLK